MFWTVICKKWVEQNWVEKDMDIALLMGEVAFVTYKKMIDGIVEQARKEDVNVFLFTCEGFRYDQNTAYVRGEYNIFNLPDLSRFAGVIVDMVTIHDDEAWNVIRQKIQESNIPAVSINIPLDIENSSVVRLENIHGIHNAIEHLVNVHGVRTIHYISGPRHNQDAQERLQAFYDSMDEFGLSYSKADISYGDFEYNSGRKAARQFIKKKLPLPDAFVASNDFMAIGVMMALQKAGYRVPEDVIVMGYDGGPMSGYVQPTLSTVKRDEYKAGKYAFRELKKLIAGEKANIYTIEGKNIFSASCGCNQGVHMHKTQLIGELTEEKIYYDHNLETLKAAMVEFSNLNTFSDFTLLLQKSVDDMGLDCFYLCLCGNREQYYQEIDMLTQGEEILRDESAYMEYGTIPLAYENGIWTSYGEFRMADILPADRQGIKEGVYYVTMPMHYKEYCIGYCVIGNYQKKIDQRFVQHMILNINNALGSIREHEIMQTMLACINDKWIYDDLTGIYNRAGLRQLQKSYVIKTHKRNRRIVVYFIDLDGLKLINDQFGHEEGDSYIKSMADILSAMDGQENVIARYGGDEYVILSSYQVKEDIYRFLEEIDKEIQRFNQSGAKHKLSASIGYQKEEDYEEVDLKAMIEQADKEMYICKKQKKASRE